MHLSTSDYEFEIDDCDVIDKTKLSEYRTKRSDWVAWLNGNDANGIWQQITALLWDGVLFQTINELRRKSVEDPSDGVGFNGSVLRLIDIGFATTQSMAIRRQCDKSDSKNPKRGVWSLRALISDIRKHRHLITREIYVAHDGLPYDDVEAFNLWANTKPGNEVSKAVDFVPAKGKSAWGMSQHCHESFDKLACCPMLSRQREDLICQSWLDDLDAELDKCIDIQYYANKFVAHSANFKSREDFGSSSGFVTLEKLQVCQKAIYQVASFLYGPILWIGEYGPLPIPPYNHLENLEKGWIAKDDAHQAYKLWSQHVRSVEEWGMLDRWRLYK